jgi:hypothetical protein
MYHTALEWSIKFRNLKNPERDFRRENLILRLFCIFNHEDIFLGNDKVHHNLVKVEHFLYI